MSNFKTGFKPGDPHGERWIEPVDNSVEPEVTMAMEAYVKSRRPVISDALHLTQSDRKNARGGLVRLLYHAFRAGELHAMGRLKVEQ